MKRLFIGILISNEIKEKWKPLYKQLKETKADLNFVSLENLHFTIKFLGNVEEDKIEEIKDKLSEVKEEKILIKLRGVDVFPSLEKINVVWIGVDDSKLVSLMKKVNEKLDYVKENEHQEKPHLTIARVGTGRNKKELVKVIEENKNKDFAEMWINKFVLFASKLTLKGPVYTIVKEFDLEDTVN